MSKDAGFSNDADITRTLASGRTLYPPGWRCVPSLDDLDDDDYEEEEEEYVVLDLGSTMDSRILQTEAAYQLIGMDTPLPFLRIGENIFEGRVTPLVGDEVLLDVVRQEDDPQKASYQPVVKTSQRVSMRGVALEPRGISREAERPPPALRRGMFPARPRRLPKPGDGGEEEASKEDTPVQAEAQPEAGPSSSPTKGGTPFSIYDAPEQSPRRRPGRGRTTLPVSTLADLADIARAGGLGEVKLEITPDAHPDLLSAVSSIRGGKEWTPGSTLSKAQEERLLRNLPASGPGSRGGRGGKSARGGGAAGGRGKRGVGRPRGRASVHESGEGLAEGFLGLGEWEGERGGSGGAGEGGTGEGGDGAGEGSGNGVGEDGGSVEPSASGEVAPAPEAMDVDSDDELREIGDE